MTGPDRFWLLTWTTYGTWLAGDERGSVVVSTMLRLNLPGTPYLGGRSGLHGYMWQRLTCAPVFLTAPQAGVALSQFRETAGYRRWWLLAVAVMRNHAHVVVGVPGDPEPDTLLRDFKCYASRALNTGWSRPVSGTWWTEGGSRRKLHDVPAAVQYVRDQEYALVVWIADDEVGGERPV